MPCPEVRVRVAEMTHDRQQIEQLAREYTEAWCSRDPRKVAAHYATGGTIAINGLEPAPIEGVAESFVAAFPDIEVFIDDLVVRGDVVEYHWTFTGTSAETGKSVRIPGFEEWTIGADGRIVESRGHYDQAEYDRQLREGATVG
jgi:predicted ester cyclase